MEHQAEADTAEEFQPHVAVARGLRRKGKRHQRHHPCGNRIHQFAPPSDGIGIGFLMIAFQVGDIGGQLGHRHLIGIDQQHVQQAAL